MGSSSANTAVNIVQVNNGFVPNCKAAAIESAPHSMETCISIVTGKQWSRQQERGRGEQQVPGQRPQIQHRCSNALKSLGAKCQSPAPDSRIAPRHVGEQHLLFTCFPWVKQREWAWLLAGKRCIRFRKTGDKQGWEERAEWKSLWEHLLCLRSIRSSTQPGHHRVPSASPALSQL